MHGLLTFLAEILLCCFRAGWSYSVEAFVCAVEGDIVRITTFLTSFLGREAGTEQPVGVDHSLSKNIFAHRNIERFFEPV